MSLTLFEIVIAFMLVCAAYRGAKRSGLWDWTMFFQVVGAILAFGLTFVGGLVYTGLPQIRPAVFFTLLFAGVALFAISLTVLSRGMTKELKRRQMALSSARA